MYAARSCSSNTLGLTLTNVESFILSYKGNHLKNNIAQECTHQIFSATSIQQWHIEYINIDTFLFG